MTVGAPAFVSSLLLPPVVLRFLRAHPGVRVHAVEDSSTAITARVRSGEIDVGIVAGRHGFDELEVAALPDQPMVACVSAASALAGAGTLSWEQLLHEPLVLFPDGYTQRSLLDGVARRLGRTPNIVCEAECADLIAALVQAGHGIGFMFAAIAEAIPGIRAVPIEGGPAIPITVCRVRKQVRSLASHAFYEVASTPPSGPPAAPGQPPGAWPDRPGEQGPGAAAASPPPGRGS